VFTAAGPQPHTFAARSFLQRCSARDAIALYAERRAEDRAALDRLGAGHVHLGIEDALFRRRKPRVPIVSRLGRVCPELVHRYPTYRFDIAKGRVARGDRALVGRLTGEVAELLRRTGAQLLFCPIGVGRHVDHLIVRSVGERFPDRVVYYSDFPYNQSSKPDPEFIARHKLIPMLWAHGTTDKSRLIRGYRTQVPALFPGGRIPVAPETYYVVAA
jgi:hypothetical protein